MGKPSIQVKEELHLKKGNLNVNDYILKIKLLTNELKGARCGINKK